MVEAWEELQFDSKGNLTLPQPNEINRQERDDAMASYFMMFIGLTLSLALPFVNLVASIIYYFIVRGKGRFVAFHAYQSLISQILISFFNTVAISYFVVFFLNGAILRELTLQFIIIFSVVALWNIVYFILSLCGMIHAYKGRFFYFPFFGLIAFNHVYGKKSMLRKGKEIKNLPPFPVKRVERDQERNQESDKSV